MAFRTNCGLSLYLRLHVEQATSLQPLDSFFFRIILGLVYIESIHTKAFVSEAHLPNRQCPKTYVARTLLSWSRVVFKTCSTRVSDTCHVYF